jgi:hypothetical protein
VVRARQWTVPVVLGSGGAAARTRRAAWRPPSPSAYSNSISEHSLVLERGRVAKLQTVRDRWEGAQHESSMGLKFTGDRTEVGMAMGPRSPIPDPRRGIHPLGDVTGCFFSPRGDVSGLNLIPLG